ncbi:hypothetical protein [Acidicapsa ligni]|uniref:hypothetical protein n=1 Tax=Acidicapsa ligni TaxID=542300 RepID=UPI0021DF6DD1|nr:hypothetical protein [Acidicapsa ligni]
MKLRLKVSFCVLALAILMSAERSVYGQSAQSAQIVPETSEALSKLADEPAAHTGFVFDRSMLQAARFLLQAQGMAPERASAALSSISYDNYRYAQPANYAPQTMASIIAAYRAAGWKHLVDAHGSIHDDGGQRRGSITDLWLHFTGSDIDGITVLARGVRDMNLVQVTCDLRPLDLVHFSGHFGIPKVDPNALMVPDPKEH